MISQFTLIPSNPHDPKSALYFSSLVSNKRVPTSNLHQFPYQNFWINLSNFGSIFRWSHDAKILYLLYSPFVCFKWLSPLLSSTNCLLNLIRFKLMWRLSLRGLVRQDAGLQGVITANRKTNKLILWDAILHFHFFSDWSSYEAFQFVVFYSKYEDEFIEIVLFFQEGSSWFHLFLIQMVLKETKTHISSLLLLQSIHYWEQPVKVWTKSGKE